LPELPEIEVIRRTLAPLVEGRTLAVRGVGPHDMRARGEGRGAARKARAWMTRRELLDGAIVEIWQCDSWGRYRHPRDGAVPTDVDEGFQGYGQARVGADGVVGFRTIRPAPYVGRTPHIHVKVRHPSFGELSSQLFVEGDPGNSRDFLWRRLSAAERTAVAMKLQPAHQGGLRWQTRHPLVLPV